MKRFKVVRKVDKYEDLVVETDVGGSSLAGLLVRVISPHNQIPLTGTTRRSAAPNHKWPVA